MEPLIKKLNKKQINNWYPLFDFRTAITGDLLMSWANRVKQEHVIAVTRTPCGRQHYCLCANNRDKSSYNIFV